MSIDNKIAHHNQNGINKRDRHKHITSIIVHSLTVKQASNNINMWEVTVHALHMRECLGNNCCHCSSTTPYVNTQQLNPNR